MKKLVMILMLTFFAAPANASILVNLPSMVLAPFGDPCPDCAMTKQTSLVTNPQNSGWLATLLSAPAGQTLCTQQTSTQARMNQECELEPLSLQNAIQKLQAVLDSITSIMKNMNSTSTGVIRNIK